MPELASGHPWYATLVDMHCGCFFEARGDVWNRVGSRAVCGFWCSSEFSATRSCYRAVTGAGC
ncbi:hypothetical protein ANAPRD1_01087 [Anaplasma phagocytophilum]|nr:hypothetical protein ANAPRD1_01087 [Anaplasma phagocytophilum]